MTIEINNESGVEVDEAALQRLRIFALDHLHVHPGCRARHPARRRGRDGAAARAVDG